MGKQHFTQFLKNQFSVFVCGKGNIFKGPFHIPRLYMIMASMDETNGITEYMK